MQAKALKKRKVQFYKKSKMERRRREGKKIPISRFLYLSISPD
jgi:hypothetical protein